MFVVLYSCCIFNSVFRCKLLLYIVFILSLFIFVKCFVCKIRKYYLSILVNSNNTWDGFGLVDWENVLEGVVVIITVGVKVGRFTKCVRVERIGFFVGFGFGRDGSFSHCVGLGFVIKFGWVVICHCVVCAAWFHKPNFEMDFNQ